MRILVLLAGAFRGPSSPNSGFWKTGWGPFVQRSGTATRSEGVITACSVPYFQFVPIFNGMAFCALLHVFQVVMVARPVYAILTSHSTQIQLGNGCLVAADYMRPIAAQAAIHDIVHLRRRIEFRLMTALQIDRPYIVTEFRFLHQFP